MDIISYAISKKFTTDTADSLGSLKGAPCTIKSKVAIDGGTRITFSWTGTSGTEQTETVDIMNGIDGQNGADGKGIKSVSVNEDSHLIITYDDDTQTDAGEITVHSAVDSVNGKTGEVTLDASDVGALPDDTEIPTKTSDLTNDSNFVSDASYVHTDNNYDTTAKNIVDGVATELANKVDKVAGKGLSTNDYDNTAKTIVDGVTAALADKADTADVIDGASYDSTNHAILFKNGSTTLFSLDAAAFVKDGMIDTVSITGGNLVITFNTDAGKQDISIPISDIFDADNYYNKTTVDTLLTAKQNTLTFDNTPTASSTNPVTSGGVKTALDLKQDTLTFDNVPTENSNNPVKSGGVYTADDKIYQVMGQNSAKNFIPFDLDRIKAKNTTGTWNGNVYSVNGIDFSFNSDGTVDASGTATETASVHYYDPVGLPPFGGDRILRLTGCPSGGSGTTYKVMAYRAGEVDGSTGTAEEYGDGISLRWLNNGSGVKAFVSISVYTGAGTIDLTFKPMLRLSTDTDNTFVPYAKTNQELTADAETLTNQVNYNTENGVKNLFHFQSLAASSYLNITWTFDGVENTIKMNSSSASTSGSYYVQKELELDPSKQYVFKATFDSGINSGLWLTIMPSDEDATYRKAISPSTPMIEYTPKAGVTKYYVYVYTNASMTYSNYNIANIMVVEKDVYNFNPTFAPYAKTNRELTEDTTALLDNLEVNGAVNMLPTDIATQDLKGATITHNSDGSYSVVKSTADSQSGSILSTAFTLKAGTYYWSASQHGHSAIGSNDCYCFIKGINGTVDWYRSTDFDVNHKWGVITLTQDSSIQFGIVVGTGASNFTFYPMITVPSYNGDYVPYAKSNRELTEDVADIVSDLTPLANTVDITNVVQWNTYYTDGASPADYSALTTQQATDIAQGLYDLMKKLFGTTSTGCRIIQVDRIARDSSGTQLGHSQGLAFIQMVQSYNTMLSNNDNARFSIMFLPYGVSGFYSFGCWGKNLRVNNNVQAATYLDAHGIFAYDTISSYKG